MTEPALSPLEARVAPCPSCGREAPIVYRGVVPHCTACGSVRAPLSSPSLNLAGKPSRLGGAVATVAGWMVGLFGASITLGVVGLLLALHWTAVALALGLPLALVTVVVTWALVRGGHKLAASADATEQGMRAQALLSLAAHRGAVTAREAAGALHVSVAEADAMLTDLAKRDPDRLAVDVDDQGVVWYRIASLAGAPLPRVRVDEGASADAAPAEDEVAEREEHAKRGAR